MNVINNQNINLLNNSTLNNTVVKSTVSSESTNNISNKVIKVEDSIISDSIYYVDFSDEIKRYMNITLKQEQTNKDVINAIYKNALKYGADKNDESSIGAHSFEAAYSLYADAKKYKDEGMGEFHLRFSRMLGGELTEKEELEFIKKYLKNYNEKFINKPIDGFYLRTAAEMDKQGLHPIHMDNYEAFNQKDWEKHTKNWDPSEAFRNKYQFSEEFAKSEKFQELYKKYEEELWKIKVEEHEAFIHGKNNPILAMFEEINEDVLSRGYTKNETIKYFENKKHTLEGLLEEDKNTLSPFYLKNGQKTVKYYENIINDLKKLWNFGDYDNYS